MTPLPRPLLRTALGRVMRARRTAQGRTLADVAAASRISVPYLSEVERGRKEASSEVLAALSDALGVPLSRLLTEVGQELQRDVAERERAERLAAVRDLRAVRRLGTARELRAVREARELTSRRSGATGAAGRQVELLAA